MQSFRMSVPGLLYSSFCTPYYEPSVFGVWRVHPLQLTSMVLFDGILAMNVSSTDSLSDLMLFHLALVNICMFLDLLPLVAAFICVSVIKVIVFMSSGTMTYKLYSCLIPLWRRPNTDIWAYMDHFLVDELEYDSVMYMIIAFHPFVMTVHGFALITINY